MVSKLKAIGIILRSHNYILISDKGYQGCTPMFGHKRFWKDSHDIFTLMRNYADYQLKPEASSEPKGKPNE